MKGWSVSRQARAKADQSVRVAAPTVEGAALGEGRWDCSIRWGFGGGVLVDDRAEDIG